MSDDMRRFYENAAEQKKWGETLVAAGLFASEARLVQRHFRPGASVLDVGCGGGREALALAAQGFRVTAVDFVPSFVEACRAAAKARGLAIDVREADATALPFADASFDHVMMVGQLLGHLRPRERRLQVLREIRRVMRPGAAIVSTNAVERHWAYGVYFAVVNAARRWRNPRALEPFDAFVRRIGGEAAGRGPRPVFHWYRTTEFVMDAQAAGWRVIERVRRWEFERDWPDRSTSGETFYALGKDEP
jgi:ubiquinone/menaquinone biosynthesis C-methylase UbiE